MIGITQSAQVLSWQCFPNQLHWLQPQTGSDTTADLGDEPAVLFDLTLLAETMNQQRWLNRRKPVGVTN